jgi:hypothetical protein
METKQLIKSWQQQIGNPLWRKLFPATIFTCLVERHQYAAWIIDRRSGITGLREIAKGAGLAEIDFLRVSSLRDLVEAYLRIIVEAAGVRPCADFFTHPNVPVEVRVGVEPFSNKISLAITGNIGGAVDFLARSLARMRHLHKQRALLCLSFDTALSDPVSRGGEDLWHFFSLLAQEHPIYCQFDRAIGKNMPHLTGFPQAEQIQPPTKAAVENAVAEVWHDQAMEIDPGTLARLVSLADYDPDSIWQLIQPILPELSMKNLFVSLQQQLSLRDASFRSHLALLTAYQKRLAVAVALTRGAGLSSNIVLERFDLLDSPYVVQGVKALLRKGMLTKHGNELLFNEPFMRSWLLMLYR